jgi:hypothetical protein
VQKTKDILKIISKKVQSAKIVYRADKENFPIPIISKLLIFITGSSLIL